MNGAHGMTASLTLAHAGWEPSGPLPNRRGMRHLLLMLGLLAMTVAASAGSVVTFPAGEVVETRASAADARDLRAFVAAWWDRYLHMDAAALKERMSDDVTRLSGTVRQGRPAVLAGLAEEWKSFERPGGVIANERSVRQARLWSDGRHATALYWLEIEGGARWTYSDQALVVQAFRKEGGRWLLVHETLVDGAEADLDDPGSTAPENFEFEFASPAGDLDRAVRFYAKLLGPPEVRTSSRATFLLRGARFHLDASGLHGYASRKVGLPAGWPEFLVADLSKWRVRTLAKGTRGPDPYVVAADPGGNVFVLVERRYASAGVPAPTGPSGFPSDAGAARAVQEAWLRTDGAALARLHARGGLWYDGSRLKTRGLESGAGLVPALERWYWPRYDRSSKGLAAKLSVRSVRVRPLGDRRLVSGVRMLEGLGPHRFREESLFTHVLDGPGVAATVIAPSGDSPGLALELDYAAVPTADLDANRRFYTGTLDLGKPYSDEDYFGWWSRTWVFGTYLADPETDGIPRPDRTNAYLSLWVPDAAALQAWLEKQGSRFPVIPSINNDGGVDSEPGYRQVYATDTEGCGVLFSEYTGRRH